MGIEYEIAADVHRRLIAALDEITTAVMAVAESGAAEFPYDRGYVDGVITVTEAMREGFNEALATVKPDDVPGARDEKTGQDADSRTLTA